MRLTSRAREQARVDKNEARAAAAEREYKGILRGERQRERAGEPMPDAVRDRLADLRAIMGRSG